MDNYKMILGLSMLIVLSACGDEKSDEMVSKHKYDTVVEECNSLKEQRQATLDRNEESAKLINTIFSELNSLSGRTQQLHKDIESSNISVNKRMAYQISQDLDIVKRKLHQVSNTDSDKKMQVIITNLQQTIAQKETEIADLMQVLEEKDREIATLGNRVNTLGSQLSQANTDLQEAEMNQWFNMGNELMEAAELLPDVKGHGNMKGVKKAKLLILQRAVVCYERSYLLGNQKAKDKKQVAEKTYRTVKDR